MQILIERFDRDSIGLDDGKSGGVGKTLGTAFRRCSGNPDDIGVLLASKSRFRPKVGEL